MSKENVTRRVSIYINDKEVENSLKGVDGAIIHVRNSLRQLVEGTEDYDKKKQELSDKLVLLKQRQADYREELGLTQKETISLRSSLTGIWDSLVSGDLEGAKDGLTSLKNGMGGLVKSSLAFIATPIGAAIAALAGIVVATKGLFDFNIEAEKGAQLIEKLSGKTGKAVEEIRVYIQSLVDTFGVEFDALANAVDNLVDTGVAKNELEALDQIKQGLLTTPDKNEFLSSLENTAIVAKNLGLDISDVVALKQQIETKGVNPDAIFGALAKATNNLKLQTDSLRAKLTDAFGASFTDTILAKVKTGQITTIQALDAIGKKSQEVGLNQTQQAQIGKEFFGKAAIAAGGYATVIDTVVQAQKKQGQELTSTQKATNDLADANLKLNKAQSELFRVESFGELWIGIKAKAADFFASTLNYITDLKKNIQPLIDLVGIALSNAWEYSKAIFVTAFDIISGGLKAFSNTIGTVIGFISKLLQGDFSGAIDVLKKGFINLGTIVSDTFGKIKNTIIGYIQAIIDNTSPLLKAVGVDVDAIQKKLESFKSKKVEIATSTKNTTTNNKPEKTAKETQEELQKQQQIRDEAAAKEAEKRKAAADKKKQELEKAAKEELDRVLGLAKAKAEVAKAELDFFIANERSKIDTTKAVTPELVAAENARLEAIKDKQLTALAEDRLSKIEKATAEAKSAEELADLKLAIDYNYEAQRLNIENGFAENKKQNAEALKVSLAEQLAADNELALAEAATKDEADKLKQEQDYQEQLKRYEKLYKDKKITEEEYNRFKKAAAAKQDELDKLREAQQLLNTLGSLNTIAGALGEMFGQSKELAIVQAGINGAMAVTKIWAEYPKWDGGFAMYAALAAAGISTLAQISKISSAKAPAAPKFFYGGATGNSARLGYDEYGPVTGYVHKNEYVIPEVMTQDPHFADTIGWLEANRQQKIRGFVDGGSTSPGIVTLNTASDNTAQLIQAVNWLNSILSNGIYAKLSLGYKEVRDISDMNDEINSSKTNGTIG
jgi:hypothetical protein